MTRSIVPPTRRGRRDVLAGGGAAVAAIALPFAARAQQSATPPVVGFLRSIGTADSDDQVAAFRRGLGEAGFVEGRNVVIEFRSAENRAERLPGLAAELVDRQVAVIVGNAVAALAAKAATATIPIVFVSGEDPIRLGLVASLARPGGNVTGVNDPAAVLSAKRLEILKDLVPAATRVAVLWNAGDHAMTLRYREIEKAAQVLRVSIEPLGVREPDDFNIALAAMSRVRPDALMMVTDALTTLNRQRVLDYAAAQRIPAMYEFATVVQAGGLLSYGSDAGESLKLAAEYASRILKGAKPGDLPVEQPNRYYLVINLKTAKSLGLTVPQALLLRADEVIE